MRPSTGTEQIPRQKLPRSQKTKKWMKETVDAIIDNSRFHPTSLFTRDMMRKTYEYYNGVIDDADYSHVLKPYGKARGNFPARMHNYPIIKPIVDLLLGEFRKRPINTTVAIANPDAVTKREKAIKEAVVENLRQHFINELSMQGQQSGMEQEVEPPEELKEAMETSYQDARAIRGQQSINYLERKLRLKNEFSKGWFHFLVSGTVVSYRDVVADEPLYEILNPLHVDYDKSPDTEFIEDGDWVVARRLLTPGKTIDYYYDELSSEEIDRIENPQHSPSDDFLLYNETLEEEENVGRLVEVMQVFWKSLKRVGIVTYMDEMGILQEKDVEEGYQKQEGETIEWYWVNEVWEGVRIDEDIYIKMGPKVVQRNSLDNISTCKLPINGRKYSDVNSPNISLVMLGIPYQLTYNIYKYRLEVAIAKTKDMIAQLDINMIPEGWDMHKWMYYVEATGIAWADYSKEGIRLNPQHQSVLDMSMNTIQDYISLLESIKLEWEQVSGVNRQRQGQISAHDGKGTTEQSIIQSSHITEDLFAKYAEFIQRDLQALLDYSRLAWIDGKKASYVLGDMHHDYLDIDGIEHMESEYGVFVSDAARDLEKVELVQELTQAMAQNGTPMSAIVDMIDATNLPQIKQKIVRAEESMQKLQQAQQEAAQQEAQAEREAEAQKQQADLVKSREDNQTKLTIAQMDNETKLRIAEMGEDTLPDDKEYELKRDELDHKKSMERDELRHQKDVDKKKLKIEEKKAAQKPSK